jgi:flagellar protein FliS
MSYSGHDAYLEGRVLSADPIELVRLLYQGCTDAVREARRQLADGHIAERCRSISRACDILSELLGSLDRERGGEIALRLSQLYDYMRRRLVEANLRQTDEPLAEVIALLATLGEAWEGVQEKVRPAVTRHPWEQAPITEPETAPAHAWSF